jgi:hypothetical protein
MREMILMANKRSRISMPDSQVSADDLQLVRGIGPALANRLNNAGIQTYTQLASMSPAKLAIQVNGLSVKQITQQDWIGQARKLAGKKVSPKPHKKETVTRTIHQHYQNFTIDFLQDENNLVRRTHVVHIQSQDADTWSGWEIEQLMDFLGRHIGVSIQHTRSVYKRNLTSYSQAPNSETERISSKVASTASQVSHLPSESLITPLSTQVALSPPHVINLAGILQLCDLRVISVDSDNPISALRQNQPYRVQLSLELSKVIAPENIPLKYKTTINFKELGGSRYLIGEGNHTVTLDNREIVSIMGSHLPPGVYRVYAYVSLTTEDQASALTAFLKGQLVPVY